MEQKTPQPVPRLSHAYAYRPEGGFKEQTSLLAALGFYTGNFPEVCALVGGGGKTTTLFWLADELAGKGKRVLVTTSTHFQCPYPEKVRLVLTGREITRESWNGPVLAAGRLPAGEPAPAGRPKLAMPQGLLDDAEITRLLTFCDVILYEADGAKRRPAKVPRTGEPVFLPQTSLVIACLGLGALGQTMRDACFRFETDGGFLRRRDGAACTPEDPFDEYAAAQILAGSRGAAKGLPPGAAYRVLLNQADNPDRLSEAVRIAERLPEALRNCCAATAYSGPWSKKTKGAADSEKAGFDPGGRRSGERHCASPVSQRI